MEQLLLETNLNGKKINYEVMLTYHHDDSNKNYVVYTDKTFNEEGKLNIYYSLYRVEKDKIKLLETNELEDKKIGLELIKEIGNLYK